MKELKIINQLGRRFQRTSLAVQKHSPEIFICAGVGGVIVSTVMACRATTKLEGILTEAKENVEYIKACPRVDDKTYKKEITVAYVQSGLKVAKNYAPAAVIGALSITSIFTSNNILKKRNVALAAAYTTLDASFKEYRTRVFDRFGEEVENEIRYNMKSQKIEEVEVDENGKEKKVKKTVKVANINEVSSYARYFEKGCRDWDKDHSYNEMFLRSQQSFANDKLKAKGRLYLNEVYDMLGFPWSKAGQVVGWVYDPNNALGDNFVDFGIKEVYKKDETKEGEAFTKVILLDFNVDGNIWDLI